MPSFRADALSYLQFVGLRRSVMIYTDLELVFKPLCSDLELVSGEIYSDLELVFKPLAADGLLLYTVDPLPQLSMMEARTGQIFCRYNGLLPIHGALSMKERVRPLGRWLDVFCCIDQHGDRTVWKLAGRIVSPISRSSVYKLGLVGNRTGQST